MGIPDFSAAQRNELTRLGVCGEQIERLRLSIHVAKLFTGPGVKRAELKALLDEVGTLAATLSRKLEMMERSIDAEHGAANAWVQSGYWDDPRGSDDVGGTVYAVLGHRLNALAHVAKAALSQVPSGPARHKTADTNPIYNIRDQLLRGWVDAQQAAGYGVVLDGEVYEEEPDPSRPLPPYPDKFDPSEDEGSTFRGVCRVVYEAAGAKKTDPQAAIRALMKREKGKRIERDEVFKKGLAEIAAQRAANGTRQKT